MTTPRKQESPAGRLRRLVLQILAALNSTDGGMMWDIIPAACDVRTRLKENLKYCDNDETQACRYTIVEMMDDHSKKMMDAVECEAEMAQRSAVEFLQNAEASRARTTTETESTL